MILESFGSSANVVSGNTNNESTTSDGNNDGSSTTENDPLSIVDCTSTAIMSNTEIPTAMKLTQNRNMSLRYHNQPQLHTVGRNGGSSAIMSSTTTNQSNDDNNNNNNRRMEFPCMEASRCYFTEKEHGQRLTLTVTSPPIQMPTIELPPLSNPFASFFGRASSSQQQQEPPPKKEKKKTTTKPKTTLGFTKQRSKSEMWYVKFDTVTITEKSPSRKRNSSRRRNKNRNRTLSTSSGSSLSSSEYFSATDDDDENYELKLSSPSSTTTTTGTTIMESSTTETTTTETTTTTSPRRSSSTTTSKVVRVLQLCHCKTGYYLSSNKYGYTKATTKSNDDSTWWIMEPAIPMNGELTTTTDPTGNSGRKNSPTHHQHHHDHDINNNNNNSNYYVLRSKSNRNRYLKYNTTGFSTRNSSMVSSGTIVVDDSDNNNKSNDEFHDEETEYLNDNRRGSGGGGDDANEEDSTAADHFASMMVDGHCEILQTTKDYSKAAMWELEFTSGELCFISNPVVHGQIRCNPFGHLTLSMKFGGWEIFRFVEVGDGNVLISSWTHSTKYLSSDPDGNVSMSEKRLGYWERWKLEKSIDGHGVLIGSVAHYGRYLSISNFSDDGVRYGGPGGGSVNNGNSSNSNNSFFGIDLNNDQQDKNPFHTTTKPGEFAKWHIDAAHSHTYYLTSLLGVPANNNSNNKADSLNSDNGNNNDQEEKQNEYIYLSSNKHGGAFLSKHRRDWEEWRLDRTFDGCVTLFSVVHKAYLGSNSSGNILTTASKGDWSIWEMEESQYGGIFLISKNHRRVLSIRGEDLGGRSDNKTCLCTVSADQNTEFETWKMEPRLPPSLSGNKMLAIGAAGIAGAAITVAMPFAVLGAVEAAGVAATTTELSLLVASGLSAEVLTGSALLGAGVASSTTAAMAKDEQELPDGMPAPIEMKEDCLSLSSKKRPICAWRYWS